MAKIFKFLPLNLIPVSTNEKTFSFKENFTIKMEKKGRKKIILKVNKLCNENTIDGLKITR